MSRNSRSYAGAALLAAWMSIPAMVHAQTSATERSLLNRISPDPRSQVGEHQPGMDPRDRRPVAGFPSALGHSRCDSVRRVRNRGGGFRFSDPGTGAARPAGPADPKGELTHQWAAGWHRSTRRSRGQAAPNPTEAFMFRVTASAPESEPEGFREPRMVAIEGTRRAAERLWRRSACCSSARRDQRLATPTW